MNLFFVVSVMMSSVGKDMSVYILWLPRMYTIADIPKRAIGSFPSNVPQNDIGKYFSLHIMGALLDGRLLSSLPSLLITILTFNCRVDVLCQAIDSKSALLCCKSFR